MPQNLKELAEGSTDMNSPKARAVESSETAWSSELSTRERIVQVSSGLFATDGFHATGISDILDAVGVSRGTFYYHIESKDYLLYEICRVQVDKMNAVARTVILSEGSPVEKMGELARLLLRNISDHRAEWVVFFSEFGALEGEWRREILTAREFYESYWTQVLGEVMSGRRSADLVSLYVKGVLGMLNYTYLWMRPEGDMKPEQVAEEFVSLLLYGMCGSAH